MNSVPGAVRAAVKFAPSNSARGRSSLAATMVPAVFSAVAGVVEGVTGLRSLATRQSDDLARVQARGFRLAELKKLDATREILEQHYAEHQGKPFFEPLVEFMMSGPVTAAVIEGQGCIPGFRSLAGTTNPTEAAPGTIRGDLGRDWGTTVQQNIVHGSDSPESAAREIAIWFPGL